MTGLGGGFGTAAAAVIVLVFLAADRGGAGLRDGVLAMLVGVEAVKVDSAGTDRVTAAGLVRTTATSRGGGGGGVAFGSSSFTRTLTASHSGAFGVIARYVR